LSVGKQQQQLQECYNKVAFYLAVSPYVQHVVAPTSSICTTCLCQCATIYYSRGFYKRDLYLHSHIEISHEDWGLGSRGHSGLVSSPWALLVAGGESLWCGSCLVFWLFCGIFKSTRMHFVGKPHGCQSSRAVRDMSRVLICRYLYIRWLDQKDLKCIQMMIHVYMMMILYIFLNNHTLSSPHFWKIS